MQIIDFQNKFSNYQIFSLQDIMKIIPKFSYRQLDRWEKKGYLRKIKQGFYYFAQKDINQNFLFYSANKIYGHSYVSLEKALKFYGLIPEEIFQITSVSTNKTANFETVVGNFDYRHVKPSLFFGYNLLDFNQQKILIADPEKAILDYLYLNPKIKTVNDFNAMRINIEEFRSKIDLGKFRKYLEIFGNKSLSIRAEIFLTTIQNDNF